MSKVLSVSAMLLVASTTVAQTLVDPTRPLSYAGKGSADMAADGFPAIKVSAVFIKNSGNYAIVNGRTVYEGDTFDGITVTSVSRSGVVISGEKGQKSVPINNNKFRKDAANER